MKNQKQAIKRLPLFGIPRLTRFIRPYRFKMAVMVFCGLAGSAIDIILPLFQRYAINHFVASGTMDTMGAFITVYVLTLCVHLCVNFTSIYFANYIEISTGRDMRTAAFRHLQTLSYSYYDKNNVGYIHARVMSDTARIGELISWSLMDGVWHISYIIGCAGVMLSIQPMLALTVLSIVPVAAVVIAIFQSKLTRLNRSIREVNSRITGNYNEGITGAKTIKSLVIEDKMSESFNAESANMKRISLKATHFSAMFGSAITFASSLALALVLWRGGIITRDGAMLIGTLSVFMSYAQGLMEPVRWIVDAISALISAQVNIERLTDLIDISSEVSDSTEVTEKYGDTFEPKKENWESIRGEIEFRDLSFRYPGTSNYILEHFNLVIPQGTNVAVVGETGAGKSTIANLAARFYEPESGAVLIDGRDVRERSQLWLHSGIGCVLQTPHLFSGTVAENLRYGNPSASDEEIKKALERVGALETVERMNGGLAAEVGEGGDLLSAGEKQLLSFARALLADPRILILDEATASIDTLTEAKLQLAIAEVIKGRTSIVIAHRLSTIRQADMILVVENGRIVERGNHSELMAQNGRYRELYTKQFAE